MDLNYQIETTASKLLASEIGRTMVDTERMSEPFWNAILDAGLPFAAIAEEHGGVGAGPSAELLILSIAGYNASFVPLAETMLAAGVLEAVGLNLRGGKMAVATVTDGFSRATEGWVFSGEVDRVPWGRNLDLLVLVQESVGLVGIVDCGSADRRCGTNLAGEPRDRLTFVGQKVEEWVEDAQLPWLKHRAARQKAALMLGAIRKILDLSIAYTQNRKQFGRALAHFQAIQQHLAILASEAAAAGMSVSSAYAARNETQEILLSAIAKIRAGDSAREACRIGHQVHGAIGISHEYVLHLYTRRLMAWRSEAGTESGWEKWLGRQAALDGRDLWHLITDL